MRRDSTMLTSAAAPFANRPAGDSSMPLHAEALDGENTAYGAVSVSDDGGRDLAQAGRHR